MRGERWGPTGRRTASPVVPVPNPLLVAAKAFSKKKKIDLSSFSPVFRSLIKPARYKGAYGGRGTGKSWWFGTLLLERCMQRRTRALCVREVQRSLEQSVKRLLEDRIEAMGLHNRFKVARNHIETPYGGLIAFQGMQNHTAESVKSLESFNIAWVEEAHVLSQRSLDLLRPTMFRTDHSEIWFSWNPRFPTDPVDALLRGETPPPSSTVVKVGYEDNPWFPDGLREEMEWDLKRDPVKWEHVWNGGYLLRSDAQVFQNWRVEEFETPDDARFYFGGDWGFSVDPSVLVRCWMDGRTLYVDDEAYMLGCEVDYLPFLFGGCQDEALRGLNKDAWASIPQKYRGMRGIEGSRAWTIIADSARPETIDYLRRHGFPKIESAKKGAGSIEEGIEFLRSYDIVVHPRCRHVRDELATYRYKTDRNTEEVLPVLEDKKNHTIDSLRYAVERARRGKSGGGWRFLK